MAAKFVVVLAALALGHCSVVPLARSDDYTSFAYDVADPNTGDYKSQVETRVGGTVQGQYSLVDSDGTKRTVDYAADDVNGFNAVVRKDPLVSVVSAPVVAQAVVEAAPAVVEARTVVGASPVVARTVAAPAVYAAHAPVVAAAPAAIRTVAAPAVYSAGHSVYAPSVYASAPYVAASPYVASAPVVARTIAQPGYYTASPLTYAAHPQVSYW